MEEYSNGVGELKTFFIYATQHTLTNLMKVLVDMDDTLVETSKAFEEIWKKMHPNLVCISSEQQPTFLVADCYPKEYAPLLKEALKDPSLFVIPAPTEGGLEAITEMKTAGHEVFICTSPNVILL